jgi:hypothetical protein
MVQAASWNLYERSHRPIDAGPETEPLRLKIVESPAKERGIGRKNCSSFTNYAIAILKAFNTAPGFRDDARKLVT